MPSAVANDGCVAPISPSTGDTTTKDQGKGRFRGPADTDNRTTDGRLGAWRNAASTRIEAWRSATPGRVVLGVLTAAVWLAAAVVWSELCLHVARTDKGLGWDLVTSWRAAVVFAHGGQPYTRAETAGRLFLYPPSSLLLMRPIAALTLGQIKLFGLVVTAVAAWVSVMASAVLVGRRWYGLTAAVVVLALRWSRPMVAELGLQNVTILCLLALVALFLLVSRQHWVAAGAVIGLSMSMKPLLIALLLVFVLARQWKPLAVAIAIPAVLNLVAFLFVSDPGEIFSKLPSLLNRSGSGVQLNSAWVDVMRSFAVPDGAVIALRLATAIVALAAALIAWRRIEKPVVRIVVTASSLLLGSYLAGTLSENHFMLTLVPLFMTVVLPGSPIRWITAWIGAAFMMGLTPPASWLGLSVAANESAFAAFGMALVLLTILAFALTRRPSVAHVPAAASAVAAS